jgi:NADH dehydrogenase FAD-containing subunit
MIQNSIVIVGGGLQDLLLLSILNNNYNVLVIEKNEFLNIKCVANIFLTKFYLI